MMLEATELHHNYESSKINIKYNVYNLGLANGIQLKIYLGSRIS